MLSTESSRPGAGRGLWFVMLFVLLVAGAALQRKIRDRARSESAITADRGRVESVRDPQTAAPPAAVSRSNSPKADALSRIIVRLCDNRNVPIEGARISCELRGGPPLQEGTPFPIYATSGIFLRSGGFVVASPSTDAQGRADLQVDPAAAGPKAGHLVISARATGFCPDDYSQFGLRIPAPGDTREIRLQLRSGKTLKGKLLNLVPEDVPYMFLKLRHRDPDPRNWFILPKLQTDGTFTMEEVPLLPLVLEIDHALDKFLEVQHPVDPETTSEVTVALQLDPEFEDRPQVVVKVVPPAPGERVTYKLVAYHHPKSTIAIESQGDTQTNLSTTNLEAGEYRLVAISLDGKPLFGETFVSVPLTGKVQAEITLKHSARIKLTLKDQATQAPPEVAGLRARVLWAADGSTFEPITSFVIRELAAYPVRGEMTADVPPGQLRVSLTHRDNRYIPVEIPLSLGAGEEKKLEATLRPR